MYWSIRTLHIQSASADLSVALSSTLYGLNNISVSERLLSCAGCTGWLLLTGDPLTFLVAPPTVLAFSECHDSWITIKSDATFMVLRGWMHLTLMVPWFFYFYNPTAHLSLMLDAHKMHLHHFLRSFCSKLVYYFQSSLYLFFSHHLWLYWLDIDLEFIFTETFILFLTLSWLTHSKMSFFYCLVPLFCSPRSWWLTHWVFMLTMINM